MIGSDIDPPEFPSGPNALLRFLLWCRNRIAAIKIIDSPDIRAEHSKQGTALFVRRQGGGGGGSAPVWLP